jgi:mitogen-activated protein kinase kinase
MDTKTLTQRPMGPRSINRTGAPLASLAVSTSDPTTNRRTFGARPNLTLSTPSAHAEAPIGRPSLSINMPSLQPEPPRTVAPAPPALSLSIPRPPNSKPSAPKIKLQINAATTGGSLFESYAGGPGGQVLQTDTHAEEKTIRPDSVTLMPAHKQTTAFDNLRNLVTELEAVRTGVPSSTQAHSGQIVSEEFSDAVFEELAHLGEGAGGAVHKVRHKPTGIIMARKTITTLEAPRKQLERELSIAAAVQHINIIKWHGTYMSPSSSEIKILMEYCEGGSLETVSKRMKEIGGVVGEKIYGKITEGVRNIITFSRKHAHLLVDLARSCLPLQQEDYPQRHQTFECSLDKRWGRKTMRLWCVRRTH